MSAARCGGFVLAGGRSSRMGSDKALLRTQGKTLLERAAKAVEQATGSAVVVGDPLRYGSFGYATISDVFAGCGPLGGIQAALLHAEAQCVARDLLTDEACAFDWNLIVACDMPGLTAAGLTWLAEQTRAHPETDVLVPEVNNRAQPLCAMYHRRALGAVERALRNETLRVMQAISELRVTLLPFRDAELFENVNTPEEWSAFAVR